MCKIRAYPAQHCSVPHRFAGFLLTLLALFTSNRATSQDGCAHPAPTPSGALMSAGVTVNDNYVPDPAGQWIVYDNYRNKIGSGSAGKDYFGNVVGGWPRFRYDDLYRFPPIADPTAIKITSQHGTWYYFLGTDPGMAHGNFRIFRAQKLEELSVAHERL